MVRGGKVIALGGQMLVHELHPTWHLNGSITVALPSGLVP
jgi:hypothetical protein